MKKLNLNIKSGIRNYLNLVKELKTDKFLKIFTIDFFSMLLFTVLATAYGFYLNRISSNLLENWDLANMDISILQKSAEELELFANDLQFFLLFFLGGLVLLIFAAISIYAYSRYLIWKELNHKKSHKHYFLKWIVIALSLGLISTIFLLTTSLIIVIIREIMLMFYYTEIYYYVSQVVSSFTGLYVMVLFINIIIAIKYSFSKTYKVWDSIGKGFSLIKEHFKSTLKISLYEWVTLLFLSFIIIFPLNQFFTLSELVDYLIKLTIFVILLAWYRIIFVKHIVKEDKSHKERSDHEHKNKEKVELKVIN